MSAGYMRRCTGKKRFETKAEAQKARGSLSGATSSNQFHAYRCDQCQGWHVGGSSNVMRTRARRPGKRPNKRMRGR